MKGAAVVAKEMMMMGADVGRRVAASVGAFERRMGVQGVGAF